MTQIEATVAGVKAVVTCHPSDVSSSGSSHRVMIVNHNLLKRTVDQADLSSVVQPRAQITNMAPPAPPCIEWQGGGSSRSDRIHNVRHRASLSGPGWDLKKTVQTQAKSETIATVVSFKLSPRQPGNTTQTQTVHVIPQTSGDLDYTAQTV